MTAQPPEATLSHLSGISVSREATDHLQRYHALLCQWQARINLVSNSTLEAAWERHFADSLQLLPSIGADQHLVDLGSGAGFPGLVLAIARKTAAPGRTTLIESNRKKTAFLRSVSRETLGAGSPTMRDGRIEDCRDLAGSADIVTARALASVEDLLSHAEWLLKDDGIALLLKGERHREEIEQARRRFDFDCEITPSVTDEKGVVLRISGIKPR